MDLKKFLFTYRSYTPLPLVAVALYGANPSKYSIILGGILIINGELLRIWGVSYAGPGTRETRVKASTLVKSGPFAYQRNPLYTGNIILYTGFAIFSNFQVLWFPVSILIVFFLQYYLIILHEEKFLKNKFPSEYQQYCQNVGRFIPRLKKYESDESIKPNFLEALKSERRTFQSIILFSAALILKPIIF